MSIIELRWIWTKQAHGIIASSGYADPEAMRPLLQYRFHQPKKGDAFAMSDWQDVPLPENPEKRTLA